MKTKILLILGIELLTQIAFASPLECLRTGIGGKSQKILVPRESIVKKGNFDQKKDNFHHVKSVKYKFVDVYKAEKTAALLVTSRFADLTTKTTEPVPPVPVDVHESDYKRASRHLPYFLLMNSGVPTIPVVQTIVNCPGIKMAANEKIGFNYKLFFRGDDMPNADYSTLELVEDGQLLQPIVLGSLPDASMAGSRNMSGEFSRFYSAPKIVDVIFTVADGQEVTDYSLLEPRSNSYPVWHFYTVNEKGYDNQFHSPTLEIVK